MNSHNLFDKRLFSTITNQLNQKNKIKTKLPTLIIKIKSTISHIMLMRNWYFY